MQPQTGLAAKFSLEFAMASGVVAKRVGLRELTDGFVQREDIQKLMRASRSSPQRSTTRKCPAPRRRTASGSN